jgi:histidinol dehydrogenase
MAQRLDARSEDFERAFTKLLGQKREVSEEIDGAVADIIADVAARGDAALIDYTSRFDGLELTPEKLRVEDEEIEAAVKACPAEALSALRFAKQRIEAYHGAQKPEDRLSTDALGVTLGWRWTALDSVGLYVPGGTASYPSSVLMNAVPAKVAGVRRGQSVRARGRKACRGRRGLSHRGRTGRRGAGLRYGKHSAGGEDRRTGQRLCGGG